MSQKEDSMWCTTHMIHMIIDPCGIHDAPDIHLNMSNTVTERRWISRGMMHEQVEATNHNDFRRDSVMEENSKKTGLKKTLKGTL